MIVYPIYHSGFFVELEDRYLLFDCVKAEIPLLDQNKPLYVFISHFHGDHYTPRIRDYTAYYLHRTFITGGVAGENFFVLAPDERLELEGPPMKASLSWWKRKERRFFTPAISTCGIGTMIPRRSAKRCTGDTWQRSKS